MGVFNIWNTSGANKASLTFTGSSDKTVDTNTVLQSTDSTASIANGKVVVDSNGNVGVGVTPSAWGSKTLQIQSNGIESNTGGEISLTMRSNSYWNGTDKYLSSNGKAASFAIRGDTGTFNWFSTNSTSSGIDTTLIYNQVMTLDSSGTLTVPGTISNSGVSKAWGNFSYASGSMVIYATYNISSITRSSTGQYVISFTNPITTNYCITTSCASGDINAATCVKGYSQSTSGFTIYTGTLTNSLVDDKSQVYFNVFR